MTQDELTRNARERYTNPDAMIHHIITKPNTAARLREALRCSEVATAPRGRFGLDSTPDTVQAVLRALVNAYRAEARPVAERFQVLRAEGLTVSECVIQLGIEDRGFTTGSDFELLGVF